MVGLDTQNEVYLKCENKPRVFEALWEYLTVLTESHLNV